MGQFQVTTQFLLVLLHGVATFTSVYSLLVPLLPGSTCHKPLFVSTSNRYRGIRTNTRNGGDPKKDANSYNFDSDDPDKNIIIDLSVSEKRLKSSIDCEHFNECAGCVVNKSVGEVEVIKSAKLFFSTEDKSGSKEYDDFYKIIVPSPLTQWRTQAKLAVAPKSGAGTWKRDGCVFGLFERKSHKVMPIPNCKVHHPSINYAVELLTKATEKVGTVPFNEQTGEGSLRYVQLQVERLSGKICLTLIWNAENLKQCQPGLSRLIKELKRLDSKLFHSIWCHTNNSLGNSIIARGEKRWHPMDGPEFVREQIPGTDLNRREGLLYFNPMAFRQGNMDGFDAIAQHVAREVPPGSKVCELYGGVGVLGLCALMHHGRQHNRNDERWGEEDGKAVQQAPLKWLHCSDENPANPRCFGRSINSMPTEITGKIHRTKNESKYHKGPKGKKGNNQRRSNKRDRTINDMMSEVLNDDYASFNDNDTDGPKVTYKVASAGKALRSGECLGANVLIVDPPRKGLEEDVIIEICKPHNRNQVHTEDPMLLQGPRHSINWTNDINTIIYISCGFDALARDTDRILRSNAGWKLKSSTGYILFPGSNHVETVAVFER